MVLKKNSPRNRILNTALRLFYEQGYMATGINQIIQESEVAKASFYEAYSSKEELGKAVLRRYQADIIRWMRSIIFESQNPDQFVKNFMKAIQIQIKSEYTIYNGCPVALFSAQFPSSNHQFRKEFNGSTEKWEKLLSTYFDKFKRNNHFHKKVNTKSFSRKVLNLYEGTLVMWRLSGNVVYITELSSQLNTLFSEAKAN